ncbi:hypothetical protein PENSPDRAFT_656665 [Peniophora sp. CONT]|nr:hypothetical protein PENSPDRAFT_656665 [Peniophora sp. CONT]
MPSKTYPRPSLRTSDALAARPSRWARFGGEIRMRSIPLRGDSRDDFPLDTVPSNIPIMYRREGKLCQTLPGTFIRFPLNRLSSAMVLHILPNGHEEHTNVFLHPRYSIPAMPFQPSPAWAEPDESPAAPPTTAVEEDDIQRHARLANAAAERRVRVYAYLEAWLSSSVLEGKFGVGARDSLILRRKGVATSGCGNRARPHVRTIMKIALSSSVSSSALPKGKAFVIKDRSLTGNVDAAENSKRTYDSDMLRNLLKNIIKDDAAYSHSLGLKDRHDLLQDEAYEGAYPVPVAGTNQILVGLALVDRSSEDGSVTLIDQGLPPPAVTAAPESTSTPAHSSTLTPAPLPEPVHPSGNPFDTDNPNPSLDALSVDELRARIEHGESLISQSAEDIANLDADIAGIEAILEAEDGAATAAPTPGFISSQSADAIEAILRRQEDRERARAERVAVEAYWQRSANQARRTSALASVPPPSSTPPRPLPRALIPLRDPQRRGRDQSEDSTNAPTKPPQATLPASLDQPRALRRQHTFHERLRPEPLREEAYVSPFSALANLSESNRRAIEARLEMENAQRQQSSAEGQDDASLSSPDSPKRKRDDEDEEGSPTTKRARSDSPSPAAEVAPVTSNTPPSSPKRKRDDDSNTEQVAFADQTVVRSPPQAEDGSPAAKRARLDSPAAEAAPAPSSPAPSLKRRRSEDEEDEAAVEEMTSLPSAPSPPPSEEGGSPAKRARSSDWCNIA